MLLWLKWKYTVTVINVIRNYCKQCTLEMTYLRQLASHDSLMIPKTVNLNNQRHVFKFKIQVSLLFRGSVLRLLDLEAHDHCDLLDELPFVRSHLCHSNVIPMIKRYTGIYSTYRFDRLNGLGE